MTSDCELINTRQISLNLLQPGLFPIKRELCEICKNYVDGTNFDNFTSGYREPREISTDCMNFMKLWTRGSGLGGFCAVHCKF